MIGQSFGNYRVTSLIGEGGMGVVYLAEHATIGRRAAVKVLRPGLTESPELARRFFNEARAANAIRHPGIVEVFDSGTLPSGVSYIVMELLEGESLAARLRRGPLPAAEARNLAAQTASALAAAHAAGIVHRDLKPDNLFLTPDDRDASAELVKVLDFGIAKLGMDASSTGSVRTRTGSVMGTPAYMSPEQCRGTKELDRRTDIYALGAILYEMLCGQTPFVSAGFGEMIHMHISVPPTSPRVFAPSVPEDLERIIMRCLAKEPDDRLQTMGEVQAALLGRAQVAAPPPPRAPIVPQVVPAAPTTFTQAAHVRDATDASAPRRGRWVALGLAVGAVAGGGLWWSGRAGTPGSATAPASATAPPATAPATPSDPPPPPPVAPKPASVSAAIRSTPAGARVVREADGAVIGMTPFDEKWPAGDGVRKLRLELDGYRPESLSVPLDRGVDLSFPLRPLPPAQDASDKIHKPGKHSPADGAGKKSSAPSRPRSPARDEPVPL